MKILNGESMKKLGDVVNENLPHILTGVGAIGVVTTSIEAAKAALAVKEIDSDESDDRKASAKAKTIIKKFIPTIISGALTIGCIVSSDVVHTKRYGSLLGAFVVAKSELPKYKQKVEEMVGADKAKEIEDKVKEEKKAEANVRNILVTRNKKYRVVDLVTGYEFVASHSALLRAEAQVAKEVSRVGHCPLSWFYEMATDNADAPEIAERIFWSNEGFERYEVMDLKIDSALDDNGEPYLTIDYEYNMR